MKPTLAILTEINDQLEPPFPQIHEFCRELALLSKANHCNFYVTSLSHFLAQVRQGYVLTETDWQKQEVPLPNAVYNRIHNRSTEFSQPFIACTQLLQEQNIPFFNPRFLHKWEVHQTLFPNFQQFLPETILFRKKENLLQMLENHEYIFIKDIYGSKGRNIFSISQNYQMNCSNGKTFSFPTFDHLFQNLKAQIGKQPYIIQQGIQLLTYEKRPFDFRILTHKKNDLAWCVTSIVARVSAENEFVSNVAKGAEMKSVSEVLPPIFHAPKIKKSLYQLAEDISLCLDTGSYGEFGIDIALDTNGHPQIIEVNSKPSKNYPPSKNLKFRPSSKAIFTYFQHIAKKGSD